MKPVVVVLTPSIDLARNDVSSTYTPGARYSGMAVLLAALGARSSLGQAVGTNREADGPEPAPPAGDARAHQRPRRGTVRPGLAQLRVHDSQGFRYLTLRGRKQWNPFDHQSRRRTAFACQRNRARRREPGRPPGIEAAHRKICVESDRQKAAERVAHLDAKRSRRRRPQL